MNDGPRPLLATDDRPLNALVTGAGGFVGRWLVRALQDVGVTVTALALPDAAPTVGHLTSSTTRPVAWFTGDLRDDAFVAEAVGRSRPDFVVHLAAISHLPTAAADPAAAWDINVTATARLLHHVEGWRAHGEADPVVLIVGSAEQYGRQVNASPICETALQAPRTVYAATKAAQEILALQLWRAAGLRVVVARSFNHSGAGQDPRFLLPALVARTVELRGAPTGTALLVGNLSPIRDFLHVSDVVSAYISLLQRGASGESYNVASGVGRSVQQVVECVLARAGVDAPIAVDPALVRPVDVPALVGDSNKLQQTTGWRATRTFEDIIDDLIKHAEAH